MLRRLLNIASIICLVVCVALMGLWLRSYYRADAAHAKVVGDPSNTFDLASESGELFYEGWGPFETAAAGEWSIESYSPTLYVIMQPLLINFHFDSLTSTYIYIPYWIPVVMTGLLSGFLWWRQSWRFSLRIFHLVLCLALLGMWIRSFRTWDQFHGVLSKSQFAIDSLDGRLKISGIPSLQKFFPSMPAYYWPWSMGTPQTAGLSAKERSNAMPSPPYGFAADFAWNYWYLILPYWFAVLIAGALGFAPLSRLKYRFSLRSLFIATTFLAVVL